MFTILDKSEIENFVTRKITRAASKTSFGLTRRNFWVIQILKERLGHAKTVCHDVDDFTD